METFASHDGYTVPDEVFMGALILCSLPAYFQITDLESHPENELTLELVSERINREYKCISAEVKI